MDRQEFNQETLNQSLHSEDADEILRLASREEFLKSNGFNRREYSRIFNKPYIEADSATGPALPAGYYSDDDFSGSGAMPTPRGPYFQAKSVKSGVAPHERNFLEYSLGSVIDESKNALYRLLTLDIPVLIRNKVSSKINNLGKIFDVASSLYLMGVDSGPINRIKFDWNDRFEIITDQYDNVLAFRRYTDRKSNGFYSWLRSGEVAKGNPVIPIGGRALQMDDIDFTNDDTIKGIKEDKKREVGGELLRDIEGIDPFSRDSRTVRLITHGESDEVNAASFERNYVAFVVSHYIYNHNTKAEREVMGRTPNGVELYRITLPHGYTPDQWDFSLFAETLGRTIGGYVTHVPYSIVEKGYKTAGFKKDAQKVEETELERMFVPRPYVPRFGYG